MKVLGEFIVPFLVISNLILFVIAIVKQSHSISVATVILTGLIVMILFIFKPYDYGCVVK